MLKDFFSVRVLVVIIPILFIGHIGRSQASIDLKAPPPVASLFAKEFVSDQFGNRDMAISPDGKELFYTLQYRGGFALSVIMHSSRVKGIWTKPEVAFFSGQYADLEPAFSPDGQKLYFSSNRPIDTNSKKDFDIWYMTKKNNLWTSPVRMKSPVNTEKNEFYPSVTRSGTIYFTREVPGKDEDIVYCRFVNEIYDTAVSLPESINSSGAEFNAYIDPDEQFIIYTAYKRKGNIGSGDLYISYKDNTGNWNESINMGNAINGVGLTYCPYVSPDKKSFFFSSSREVFQFPFEKPKKMKEIRALLAGVGNGWDNIYWVEAKQWIK